MNIKYAIAGALALSLTACSNADAPATNDAVAADNMAMDSSSNMDVIDNEVAPPATQSGQDYADKAAASDMFEIESARLAQDKAQSADVKALAAMLIKDHQKSTADLKTAAGKAEPAIRVEPALDAEQSANLATLRTTAAADFDRVWLGQQVAAHEKALAMVKGYAASGDVTSLKEHAGKVAGPVEMHLNRARELSQQPGQ